LKRGQANERAACVSPEMKALPVAQGPFTLESSAPALFCAAAALGGCEGGLPLQADPPAAAQEAPMVLLAEGERASVEVTGGGRRRRTTEPQVVGLP
jgi:hypothetical protein